MAGIALKQCLAGKSLNGPPCSLQEGAHGNQPLQGWPQKCPPSLQPSQTQAVLSLPLALFAEGIKVLLGKPPLCSDNCLQSQL